MKKLLLIPALSALTFSAYAQTPAMSRGDFAVYVQAQFKLPEAQKAYRFVDVPASSKYYAAVQAIVPHLHSALLCPGCFPSAQFRPNEPISRAEASIVLTSILVDRHTVRLLSPDEARAVLSHYADAPVIPATARPYLATAVKNGVLAPTNNALRASEPLSEKLATSAVHAAAQFKQ